MAFRVRRRRVWSGTRGGRARAEHRSGRPLLPPDRRRAVVTRHPYRHRGHAGARVLHGCRAPAGRHPCRGKRQLRAVRRARGRSAGRTRAPRRCRDRSRAAAGGGVAAAGRRELAAADRVDGRSLDGVRTVAVSPDGGRVPAARDVVDGRVGDGRSELPDRGRAAVATDVRRVPRWHVGEASLACRAGARHAPGAVARGVAARIVRRCRCVQRRQPTSGASAR